MVRALATAGLLDQYGVDGNMTEMGATSETVMKTTCVAKMMKMPYYPQSLVQLNANKVGLFR